MDKRLILTGIFAIAGCSTTATTTIDTSPKPSNIPQTVSTVPIIKKEAENAVWNFAYTPGRYSYIISTKAEIQREGAETQNSSRDENVTFEIGNDQTITLVEPAADSGMAGCTGKNASLRARASQILPKLPNNLKRGMVWSDSVTTNGCSYMGAATVSTWIRNFTVGETTKFEGKDALEIKRNSTITGKGQGTEGQHQIFINADGTDDTSLFIDPVDGKFLGSNTSQNMNIAVNISAQWVKFKQKANVSVHQP